MIAELATDILTYAVNEVYSALQGEGVYSGFPTTFLRFQGCLLRCSYCDSMYAVPYLKEAQKMGEGKLYTFRELQALIRQVNFNNSPHYCFTGGEPLQRSPLSLMELINWIDLSHQGKAHIVVETSGYIPLSRWIDYANKTMGGRLHFCTDYKLPGSRMTHKMIKESFDCLRPSDSIKYVVSNMEDLWVALDHLRIVREEYKVRAIALISPVWEKGSTFLQDLTEEIQGISRDLDPYRLSLQMHKVTHPPLQRRV